VVLIRHTALVVVAVVAASAACVACVACGSNESSGAVGKQSPVDVYRRHLAPLSGMEQTALSALDAAMGDRYHDDATLRATLGSTALPSYRQFVAGLEALEPHPDVAPVHERLLAIARRQLAALEQLDAALAAGNGTAVLLVNRELRLVARERARLAVEIDALRAPPEPATSPPPGR
jgi:hypothetical protein